MSLAINLDILKVKPGFVSTATGKLSTVAGFWNSISVLPAIVRVGVLCAHCVVAFAFRSVVCALRCFLCTSIFTALSNKPTDHRNKPESFRARVHKSLKDIFMFFIILSRELVHACSKRLTSLILYIVSWIISAVL